MRVFRRFRTDQSGATAVLFGLALLPVMGVVGAAVDYSRASNEQTRLQRATDAAVLTLVREPRTATAGQMQQRAALVYGSLYTPRPGVTLDPPVVTRVGETLTVTRAARMTNAFLQVFGVIQTEIGSQAEASWSQQRIELALVLDNTGSMRERIGQKVKIEELRRSALDLVTRLRGVAVSAGDLRVSVVPFDTEVRLDAATYRNRDWLRWDDPSSQAERNRWTGYVVDRFQPKDVTDDAPAMALRDTLYPKLAVSQWRSAGDLATVRPLTSLSDAANVDALTATINAMQPRGNTNVGLGVSWGLATLTGSVPLDTPSITDSRKAKRYMVVLTDGENTQRWVDGVAKTPASASPSDPVLRMMNDRTVRACGAAKDAAVEVFTIRLLDGDAAMLGACASAPTDAVKQHYFDVQSAQDLDAAFGSILGSITATRLTH